MDDANQAPNVDTVHELARNFSARAPRLRVTPAMQRQTAAAANNATVASLVVQRTAALKQRAKVEELSVNVELWKYPKNGKRAVKVSILILYVLLCVLKYLQMQILGITFQIQFNQPVNLLFEKAVEHARMSYSNSPRCDQESLVGFTLYVSLLSQFS